MKGIFLFLILWFNGSVGISQVQPVRVLTENQNQRIAVYAINESDRDYDVKVLISGSNFRQSRARPRFIRVPAASKVFVKTIIPFRDKKPEIQIDIELADSLSNRSLIRDFEPVKLKPPQPLIIYLPSFCTGCAGMVASMEAGKYQYTRHNLAEHPEMRQQLEKVLGRPLDTLPLPVTSLGGKLYTKLAAYDEVLELLKAQ